MIDYVLNYSLKNNQKITIIYQKGLKISQRDIKVLKINDDIVYAYCYARKSPRKFCKDRILAAMISSVLNNSFDIDTNINYYC